MNAVNHFMAPMGAGVRWKRAAGRQETGWRLASAQCMDFRGPRGSVVGVPKGLVARVSLRPTKAPLVIRFCTPRPPLRASSELEYWTKDISNKVLFKYEEQNEQFSGTLVIWIIVYK